MIVKKFWFFSFFRYDILNIFIALILFKFYRALNYNIFYVFRSGLRIVFTILYFIILY